MYVEHVLRRPKSPTMLQSRQCASGCQLIAAILQLGPQKAPPRAGLTSPLTTRDAVEWHECGDGTGLGGSACVMSTLNAWCSSMGERTP